MREIEAQARGDWVTSMMRRSDGMKEPRQETAILGVLHRNAKDRPLRSGADKKQTHEARIIASI
jgi:hypothetical protein